MKARLFTLALFLLTVFLPLSVHAVDPLVKLKDVGDTAEYATAETVNVESLAAKIINTFLSILGTVFLGYLIYGGFIWMNAQGNEEEVKKAKNIITQAIIGLAIVMAAYAISYFVASSFENAALKGPPREGDPNFIGPPRS